MEKKKKDFTIQILRRGSYRWPGRWQAEKRAKLERGVYYCESCGLVCKKKDTQMDHVIPVVDPNQGFIGFDDYIDKMYCDEFGFQRLCKSCHDSKTKAENQVRKETKQKKKKSS